MDAQFAIYGVAQGAAPVRTDVDEKIVMLCEYCLDCPCHGRCEEEWAAVAVLSELRRGFAAALASGVVVAREVDLLVDVTAQLGLRVASPPCVRLPDFLLAKAVNRRAD